MLLASASASTLTWWAAATLLRIRLGKGKRVIKLELDAAHTAAWTLLATTGLLPSATLLGFRG